VLTSDHSKSEASSSSDEAEPQWPLKRARKSKKVVEDKAETEQVEYAADKADIDEVDGRGGVDEDDDNDKAVVSGLHH
jgi:hypothetical protein